MTKKGLREDEWVLCFQLRFRVIKRLYFVTPTEEGSIVLNWLDSSFLGMPKKGLREDEWVLYF
jgi:hypothetical protein